MNLHVRQKHLSSIFQSMALFQSSFIKQSHAIRVTRICTPTTTMQQASRCGVHVFISAI